MRICERSLQKRSPSKKTIFLPWGPGDAVFPLVSAGDVVDVAADLLSGPLNDRANEYDLVGERPTVNEIVSTLASVLGQPIRYIEISDERWIETVRDRINPHALDHLSHLWQFFRTSGIPKGQDGFHVTDTTQKLVGKPPESLEQFFRTNGAAFGATEKPVSAA